MLGIPAFLGCLTVLFLTIRIGMGLTYDSLIYITVSKSILSGKGYDYYGALFHQQPPLYPTLLALLSLGGFDPADAARLLNVLSYGLIIIFSGKWLWKTTQSHVLALLGSGAVLVSVPLLQVHLMAWTEPLFIALLTLFFFQFDKFLREDHLQCLFGSAILVSLACLTRYMGVAALFAGLISLILKRNWPLVRKLISVAVFGVISTLPTLLWLTRNFILGAGARDPSSYTLSENCHDLIDIISSWFLPSVVPPVIRFSVAAAFVIVLLSYITALIWHDKMDLKYRSLMPILSFFFSYSILLLYAATTVSLTHLDNRYLSPIYIPLVILLCGAIHFTKNPVSPHFMKGVLNSFFIAGIILILLNSLLEPLKNSIVRVDGAGMVFVEKYDSGGSAEAYVNSGLALAKLRRFGEAVAWYQRALELSSDSYDVHNNLGIALRELGHLDIALNNFRQALKISPHRVEAYTNIGVLLLNEGKINEAAEFFSVVIGMQPYNVQMYANLGSIREVQGRIPEAVKIYREALKRKPDYEPAPQRLNMLLAKK